MRILTGQRHFSHRSPVKEMKEINVEWIANLVSSRSLFSYSFILMGLRSPDETLCLLSVRLMSRVEHNINFHFFHV
jgi:hypothetical protein